MPGERKSTSTISTDEDSLGSFKDSPFNVSLSMTDFRIHQISGLTSSLKLYLVDFNLEKNFTAVSS